MSLVCAWCGSVVRSGGVEVTHGICGDCRAVFERRWETVRKGRTAP